MAHFYIGWYPIIVVIFSSMISFILSKLLSKRKFEDHISELEYAIKIFKRGKIASAIFLIYYSIFVLTIIISQLSTNQFNIVYELNIEFLMHIIPLSCGIFIGPMIDKRHYIFPYYEE